MSPSRSSRCHACAGGSADLGDELGALLLERAGRELHHRAGRRVAPGERAADVSVAHPLEQALGDDDAHHLLADHRIVDTPRAPSRGDHLTATAPAARPAHVAGPFTAERALGHTPTLVDLADHGVVAEPHAFEEHLVEVPSAGDVDERSHGDARARPSAARTS